MNFANNLKRLRLAKEISQEQLADQLNVSRQAVSRWETGDSFPEMDKVLELRRLFGVPLDELMTKADLDTVQADSTKQARMVFDTACRRLAISATLFVVLLGAYVSLMSFVAAGNFIFSVDTGTGVSTGGDGFGSGMNTVLIVITFILNLACLVCLASTICRGITLHHTTKTLGRQTTAELYSKQEANEYSKTFASLLSSGIVILLLGIGSLLAVQTSLAPDPNSAPSVAALMSMGMSICTVSAGLIVYASIMRWRFRNRTAS